MDFVMLLKVGFRVCWMGDWRNVWWWWMERSGLHWRSFGWIMGCIGGGECWLSFVDGGG